MIDYTWVRWFRELACKIAEGGPKTLVPAAKAVDWLRSDPPILQYGDNNVDPFSFIYTLSSHLGDEKFERRLQSAHEAFGIEAPFPRSRPHIPTPIAMGTLFHNAGTGQPSLLWRLFRQVAKDVPEVDASLFDSVLDIGNVRIAKLTQTLFIVNASHFCPADSNAKGALGHGSSMVLREGEFEELPTCYAEYEKVMGALKGLFPGCAVYEINTFLDVQESREPLITGETRYFQVSTRVEGEGSQDYWDQFAGENAVWTGYAGADDRPYPLSEPRRGDVILVRHGRSSGHGVGVVQANGYVDGWSEGGRISVYWINKQPGPLGRQTDQRGFGAVGSDAESYKAFREAGAYSESIELIERLAGRAVDEGARSQAVTGEASTMMPLNRVLYGPPGTGKTFDAVSLAVEVVDGTRPCDRASIKERFDELAAADRVGFVTFHQNYAYEDFIEGIRPVLDVGSLRYELRDGIFKQFAERANADADNRYVLIIDEINRGNIAKIFGELITLIEPSKRLGEEDELQVTLPYSQEPFGVPPNLYLIGTMNTADRGIALLDVALRRRFEFDERMPDVGMVAWKFESVNGGGLLQAINRRIVENLDREHQIGHTYLMKVDSLDALARVFRTQIIPLLQEYFYDDWEKMRRVLNDNDFIIERKTGERAVFDVLSPDDDAWRRAESYRAIYGNSGGPTDE